MKINEANICRMSVAYLTHRRRRKGAGGSTCPPPPRLEIIRAYTGKTLKMKTFFEITLVKTFIFFGL